MLRDENTDRATFRRAVDNLAAMLIYEATRDLEVEATKVQTPLGPAEGVRLPRLPALVPVLRAGLGMADAAIRLLPEAEMSFIGLPRDEETFEPHPYMAQASRPTRGPTGDRARPHACHRRFARVHVPADRRAGCRAHDRRLRPRRT